MSVTVTYRQTTNVVEAIAKSTSRVELQAWIDEQAALDRDSALAPAPISKVGRLYQVKVGRIARCD